MDRQIAGAIEQILAKGDDKTSRTGNVLIFGGHGCGNAFHEEPFVSYVSKPGTGMLMVPGMVFTIEPMVNMGTDRFFTDADNGWTVYTGDGKPSAQWEIEVLVTETGAEVLSY